MGFFFMKIFMVAYNRYITFILKWINKYFINGLVLISNMVKKQSQKNKNKQKFFWVLGIS